MISDTGPDQIAEDLFVTDQSHMRVYFTDKLDDGKRAAPVRNRPSKSTMSSFDSDSSRECIYPSTTLASDCAAGENTETWL